MRYEWDEAKRRANLAKHGLDFVDAWRVFESFFVTDYDDRHDYGEDRWSTIGLLFGREVVVIYVEPDEEARRVISLRKATTHERERYERAIRDRLGPS